jgi:hypothetical protein
MEAIDSKKNKWNYIGKNIPPPPVVLKGISWATSKMGETSLSTERPEGRVPSGYVEIPGPEQTPRDVFLQLKLNGYFESQTG